MLEKTFNVSYYIGVSLEKLVDRLIEKAKSAAPWPPDVAVGLTTTYRLNSTPWRKHTKDWVCHHLAQPSAATVASACDRALCAAGLLKPGQVTMISVAKFVDDVESNVLEVTIKQITERLKADKSFFNLEFLKWYENWCAAHGVEPSLEEYLRRRKNFKTKKNKCLISDTDKEKFKLFLASKKEDS